MLTSPSYAAKKRTVFFPSGKTWDGTAFDAQQIDLTPLVLDSMGPLDFSVSADTVAPKLALRGNAKVAADPACEKGTCVIIEEPARDPMTPCTTSMAAFRVTSSTSGAGVRIRILGQDPKDTQRVAYTTYSGDAVVFDDLKPSATVSGFTHDSGWFAVSPAGVLAAGGGGTGVSVLGCAPNVRVMLQSAM
jgi:hypothetical protein